ncbi:carboxylesterase [Marinomonas piezotolerans]|uniref:Carboxylesterase n=1 Tax=Marinomonas piezotolerans TaxID=2213058 RepID=A0A370U7C2_9GAMM|nr:alpha/beta fold hydrolase [Marinomonas piezotolerans]RDL43671.1 carboxylesterase [Marinomonas piezotolerans]
MRTPIETEAIGNPVNPAIFFVSGWAMPKEVFHGVARHLSRDFYVVIANLPGVSADPDWHKRNRFGPNYDIDALAEQLIRSAPKPCWWVGWSLGGMIANYIAARRSSCVEGVITIASSAKFVASDSWVSGMERETFEQFSQLVAQMPEKGFKRFLALQSQGAKEERIVSKRLLSFQPKELIDPEALSRGLGLLSDLDVRREIELLDVPNLHMFGAQDPLVSCAKTIAEFPSNPLQTVISLPECSHQPFIEDEPQFVAMVQQYINEHSVR